MSRIKTAYEGVFYRERQASVKGRRDRTYEYCFNRAGKKFWVTVGRASEGVTPLAACKARLDRLARANEKDATIAEAVSFKARQFDDPAKARKFTCDMDKHLGPLADKTFGEVTTRLLLEWKAGLLGKMAPASVTHVIALVSSACSLAISAGLTAAPNPMRSTQSFRWPRPDNKGERFLTRAEAEALIGELGRTCPERRDMAIVSLNSGLRCGELYRLTGADVNAEARTVSVRGKNGKRETVPLNDAALAALMPRVGGPSDRLFPRRGGYGGFRRAVDRLGLNDGVTDRRHRVWFHTFRHTFASWLVQAGVDLYSVQRLMRHATPAMTQRYAHLRADDLRKALGSLPDLPAGPTPRP